MGAGRCRNVEQPAKINKYYICLSFFVIQEKNNKITLHHCPVQVSGLCSRVAGDFLLLPYYTVSVGNHILAFQGSIVALECQNVIDR